MKGAIPLARRGGSVALDRKKLELVVLDATGAVIESEIVPAPRGGYGGSKLIVSPDERHAAVFLFTGASSQGWELYSIEPTLQRRAGLPCIGGEGEPPVFSPDGALLVMATTGPVAWIDDEGERYDDVEPEHRDAPWQVEWAQLHVQDLATGAIERVVLAAALSGARGFDPCALDAPTGLAFESPRRLAMKLPWKASATIDLPAAGTALFAVTAGTAG